MKPKNPKGLDFLRHAISLQSIEGNIENVFDTTDKQLQSARSNNKEYTLVMPMFQITSNIPAEKYLRQVNILDMSTNNSNIIIFL